MKTSLIVNILVFVVALSALGQENLEATMEKRAREMHRVIKLNDPAEWKKFIQENYSKALIEKPMRATVETSDQGATTAASTSGSNLETKVQMFEQLHGDFGQSEILSIKPQGQFLEMVLSDAGSGLRGTFNLRFDKTSPYLISGIGIDVGN